eukprot:s680_g13.t1
MKLKKAGMSGGAIKAAYRTTGIECLTFLMICGLNVLWGGLRRGTRLPRGPVRPEQQAAVDRLKDAAAYMVDGKDGKDKGGFPRTPTEGWEGKLKDARISYHGETIAKAEPLELDRVIASLSPEGYGGAVNILDVCEGEVLEKLRDPFRCVLPDEEMPLVIPTPRVQVKDGDWESLAKALYDRGILAPTEEVITVGDQKIFNGLFGVEKQGRDLADGRKAQRLIMDLRATNAILRVIGGDIKTLGGAAGFTTVSLQENQLITISGDDLVASFYLFKMPPSWLPFLSFGRPISWRSLGVDKDGETHLASAVLPMGFSSSVGVMQHIHRRLALWDPRAPAWALYLDDSTVLRKVSDQLDEELRNKPGPEQEALRKAYSFWGIPYNLKKAIEEVDCTERLGAFLDGHRGRIGVTVERTLECISLGHWVLSQGQTSRKSLQVFGGKEVHCLQFRRPLFSVYDGLWGLIAGDSDTPYLTRQVCQEIMVSLCLAPLRFTDWRAEVDPQVMATDASESGGGFVMARRLTKLGEAAALAGSETAERRRNGVVIFDFFSGIGGLLRSLERAGLVWEHHVTVESDKRCRKCVRRTWPGGSEYTDITKLSKTEMAAELDKVENLKLVVGGGGSPCQGLSMLSSGRKHFADERSKLFYDLSKRLKELEELCKERGARFLGMVENVKMDESDRDDISLELGWTPNLCESDVANKITLVGEVEPDELWIPEGFSWDGSGTNLRLPTFTRPIKRRRPPPDPAELAYCSEAAKTRWQGDCYRYPPYTYEDRFLLKDSNGDFYKVPAGSREILMGFPKGHTKKLDRELFAKAEERHTKKLDRELFAKAEESEEQDARQNALGNSFHTTTVATLLGAVLFHMGFLDQVRGPDVLLQLLIAEDAEGTSYWEDDQQSTTSQVEEPSLAALEELEALQLLDREQEDLKDESQHKMLMCRLVSTFLRKVELRGSDLRAFKWAKVAHINILELKALMHAVQWRARRQRYHSFKTMILCDNQSVVAVVTKGRSSSKQVNHLLRRLASLCCALNLYLIIGWVDTSENPADKASRIYDADR